MSEREKSELTFFEKKLCFARVGDIKRHREWLKEIRTKRSLV